MWAWILQGSPRTPLGLVAGPLRRPCIEVAFTCCYSNAQPYHPSFYPIPMLATCWCILATCWCMTCWLNNYLLQRKWKSPNLHEQTQESNKNTLNEQYLPLEECHIKWSKLTPTIQMKTLQQVQERVETEKTNGGARQGPIALKLDAKYWQQPNWCSTGRGLVMWKVDNLKKGTLRGSLYTTS
jgi:hypothetical protein